VFGGFRWRFVLLGLPEVAGLPVRKIYPFVGIADNFNCNVFPGPGGLDQAADFDNRAVKLGFLPDIGCSPNASALTAYIKSAAKSIAFFLINFLPGHPV
jgi:hypothetical protein